MNNTPLNERCRSIVLDIIKNPSSIKALAHKYKVSERTIRTDISNINYFLVQRNFSILKKNTDKTLYLPIESEKSRIIFQLINNHNFTISSFSKNDRILELLIMIAFSNEPIKLDQIAEKLLVSKSSIIKDTEVLKKYLSPLEVHIVGSNTGIILNGEEINIRLAILHLFFSQISKNDIKEILNLFKNSNSNTCFKVHWRLFENTDLDFIKHIVEITKNILSIHLSDYMYLYSVAAYSIMIKRIPFTNHNDYLLYKKPFTCAAVTSIFNILKRKYPHIKDVEKNFIYNLIIRLTYPVYIQENNFHPSKEIHDSFKNFKDQIKDYFILSNQTMCNIEKEFLSIYFEHLFHHKEHKNVIELNDSELISKYNIVQSLINQTNFPYKFSADDYWRIVWHIINEKEFFKPPKKNIVIVSDKPRSLINIFINKLEKTFNIEILGITSITQLEKYQKYYHVDYFISTMSLPTIKNVLKVHPLLQESEILFLKKHLDTPINDSIILDNPSSLLKLDFNFSNIQNIKTIIDNIDQILIDYGIVTHSVSKILKHNYINLKNDIFIFNKKMIFSLREHEIIKKNLVIEISCQKNINYQSILFLFFTSQEEYINYFYENF